MSAKIANQIREACGKAKAEGIQIVRGPWSTVDNGKLTELCAVGAVLWSIGKLNASDRIPVVCRFFEVDSMWLRRFWMGFDRNFQAKIIDKDGQEHLDEVSKMGIELAKELVS